MTKSYPYQVSAELCQAFRDNGFVVTEDVFTNEELVKYKRAIDAEVALRTQADTRDVADKSLYEQSFIQCMRLWETDETVRRLSCSKRLAGIATQLLDVDGVLLWQDQALYKEGGGRETTPHQDQTFWPIGMAPLVSAWIPLVDVTVENGAMSYVPGSHQAGALKVVDITHTTDPYDILNDPAIAGANPQCVEIEAGSVVWHHGFCVHMAAANRTQSTRCVFTTVYISDNATRAKSWPAYPLDRDDVEVGDVICGPGMPQVWPPSDELPSVPKKIGDQTGPQYRLD